MMVQDIRYAVRLMLRAPAFTTVAILSLALGIGSNTAIFSLLDEVLLKRLPVERPGELVEVHRADASGIVSYPLFREVQAQREVFSGAFAVGGELVAGIRVAGAAHDVRASGVSTAYFDVLGARPVLGRGFVEEDGGKVAVISHGFWQRALAHDRAVPGKTIALGGTAYTIIGVAPPEFSGVETGRKIDLWLPISELLDRRTLDNRVAFVLRVMARRKAGVSVEQARAAVDVMMRQLQPEWFGAQPAPKLEVTAAGGGLTTLRRRFSKPLWILMSAVGLVLLMACANVANLLLARATARQKEIAVRLAIGAGRGRIARQFLTESVLLSLLGGALGLAVAYWSRDLLLTYVRASLPFRLDVRVLSFTAAIAALAGIGFGLAPALRATRLNLNPMLKSGAGSRGAPGELRLGRILAMAQVALSVVLVAGAALCARSLYNLRTFDAGFEKQRVVLLEARAVGPVRDRSRVYQDALDRLQAVPGVRSASMSSESLFGGNMWTEAVIAPGYNPRPGEDREAVILTVAPRFFETMGTALVKGRDFAPQDHETAPRVAIVNEAMARYYFAGQEALGKPFAMDHRNLRGPIEIIGVVRDAKYRSLRQAAPRIVYLPYRQMPQAEMTIEVRTAGPPAGLLSALPQTLRSANQNLRLGNVTTQASLIERSISQDRLLASASGVFGMLALVLACVGLYGLMSYAVSRRTGEAGVRMALGARSGDLIWLMLRETLGMASAGAAAGVLASIALTRVLASALFELTPADPVTLAGATVAILAVAALAGYLPARRMARVDPITALRWE
ncbi:MAG: ABC transporter permease [Bryobacteraceae bacterium]